MNISDVVKAIDAWSITRNTAAGYRYLVSGLGFHVSRETYDLLKANKGDVSDIKCHLGIWNGELIFILTTLDDLSKGSLGENIFVEFYYSAINAESKPKEDRGNSIPSVRISESEAMKRHLRWMLYSKDWFGRNGQEVGESNGIVKYFLISFSDFEEIFIDQSVDEIFSFFGIRSEVQYGELIELIFCSATAPTGDVVLEDGENTFTDFTKPVPPYG